MKSMEDLKDPFVMPRFSNSTVLPSLPLHWPFTFRLSVPCPAICPILAPRVLSLPHPVWDSPPHPQGSGLKDPEIASLTWERGWLFPGTLRMWSSILSKPTKLHRKKVSCSLHHHSVLCRSSSMLIWTAQYITAHRAAGPRGKPGRETAARSQIHVVGPQWIICHTRSVLKSRLSANRNYGGMSNSILWLSVI